MQSERRKNTKRTIWISVGNHHEGLILHSSLEVTLSPKSRNARYINDWGHFQGSMPFYIDREVLMKDWRRKWLNAVT